MEEIVQFQMTLSRSEDAEDPFAFRFKPQKYQVPALGGKPLEMNIQWSAELMARLQALRGHSVGSDDLKRFGDELRRFLPQSLRADLERVIAESRDQGRSMHLTLRLSAAELFALPWGLLTLSGSGEHLCQVPNLLVRYAWPTETKVSTPRVRPAGGRILLAWSDAGGPISGQVVAGHVQAIKKACAARGHDFDEARDVLPQASWLGLFQRLQAAREAGQPVAVLHLLAHGTVCGQTVGLALYPDVDDTPGAAAPTGTAVMDSTRLQSLLAGHARDLQLLVLSSCESANMGDLGNHLGGSAQAAHRLGVRAVLASRYPLSIVGAMRIADVLYHSLLVEGTSLERAVLTARTRLLAHENLDWISLQLYAREEHGGDTRPLVFYPFAGCETDIVSSVAADLSGDAGASSGGRERSAMLGFLRQPASRAGLALQPGLEQALLDAFAGHPHAGQLLLQVLRLLWQGRVFQSVTVDEQQRLVQTGEWLTLEAYEAMGQLPGILAELAGSAYRDLDDAQRTQMRRLLVQLAADHERPEQSTCHTLSRAALRPAAGSDASAAAFDSVVELLLQRAILVQSEAAGEALLTIGHEALFQGWPVVQGWIREDRSRLWGMDSLRSQAMGWMAAGATRPRDPLLLRGQVLQQAEQIRQRCEADLGEGDRILLDTYLEVSRAARDSDEDEARIRRIHSHRTALFALGAWLDAEDGALQAALAEVGALVMSAESAFRSGQSLESVRRAEQAASKLEWVQSHVSVAPGVRRDAQVVEDAQRALTAIRALPERGDAEGLGYSDGLYERSSCPVKGARGLLCLDFLGGHERLLTGWRQTPFLRVLDTTTGEAQAIPVEDRLPCVASVRVLLVHANGQRVVTGDDAGQVVLWEPTSWKPLAMANVEAGVVALAGRAGGPCWAVGDAQGRIHHLSLGADGELSRALVGVVEMPVMSLGFVDDNTLVVVGGAPSVQTLWRTSERGGWACRRTLAVGGVDRALPTIAREDGLMAHVDVSGNLSLRHGTGALARQLQVGADVTVVAVDSVNEFLVVGRGDGHLYVADAMSHAREIVRHRGALAMLRFSQGGRWLASLDKGGELRIWEVAQPLLDGLARQAGALLERLERRRQGGDTALVAPQVAAVERALSLAVCGAWEVACWRGHAAWPKVLTCHPEGNFIVSGGHCTRARKWTHEGGDMGELRTHDAAVTALAVSALGDVASADGAGQVLMWAGRGHVDTRVSAYQKGEVTALAFDAGGKHLAVADVLGRVHVWARNGDLWAPPLTCEQHILALRWIGDGCLLMADEGGVVTRCVLASDGQSWQHTTLFGTGGVRLRQGAVALGVRDAALVGCAGNEIFILNEAGEPQGRFALAAPIQSVALHRGGMFVAAGCADGVVVIWQRSPGEVWGAAKRTLFRGHAQPVVAVDFLNDTAGASMPNVVSASTDLSLRIWRLANPFSTSMEGHRGTVWAADWSPCGRFVVTGGEDGSIRLWRVDGTFVCTLNAPGADALVRQVRFCPCVLHERLWLAAVSHDGTLAIYAIAAHADQDVSVDVTGGTVFNYDKLQDLAFSADGSALLVLSLDGRVFLLEDWQSAQGLPEPVATVDAAEPWGLTWLPGDQAWLEVLGDGSLWRRERSSGQAKRLVCLPKGVVRVAACQVDGHVRVALASIAGTWAYQLDGDKLTPLLADDINADIMGVAWSRDGQKLTTVGLDGRVRIWQVPAGQVLRTLSGYGSGLGQAAGLSDVAFSPDDQALVTASHDGTARIWRRLDLTLEDLVTEARRLLRG